MRSVRPPPCASINNPLFTCAIADDDAVIAPRSPARVDVSRLEVHRPVTRHEVQLTTKAGGALGCVRVECVLDYVTGAVSSFELNEHLSKMDDTLPLAPPPSIRTPEAGRKEREEKAVALKKTSSAQHSKVRFR